MKIEISENVHSKLRKLAQANEITITNLVNALLSKMLYNHHEEVKQLIKQMKKGEK